MKHNLFSRFTSVLLAVVLLASVMSTPILATEGVAVTDGAVTTQQEQPATDGQQPATDGQQPATDGQQPATEGEQPATDGQQPATEGEQPATDGQQPATDGQQPATDGQQPATENEQPADEGLDATALLAELMAIEDDEAFLATVQALTDEQAAALEALGEEALADYAARLAALAEKAEPTLQSEQPAVENEQPADEAEQPADEAEQPADGNEQPAAEGEQPAEGEQQPLDAQALLEELMAIEDDEAFLAAVQALTEEQIAALEALGEEALAGLMARLEALYAEEKPAPVDYNAMNVAELYAYLSSLTSDSLYFQVRNSLTEEKLNELWQYIDSVSAGESRTVVTNIDNGIVDFTSAAPLVAVTAPYTVMRTMMRAAVFSAPSQRSNAFNTSDEEQADGLEIRKYISAYDPESGTGTLTLEAYVTGNVTTTTQSVPVDVVLVLDQSGSMAWSFGSQQIDVYTPQSVNNSTAYSNANKYWPTQYYMQGDDGNYYEVDSITSDEAYTQIDSSTTLKDLFDRSSDFYGEDFYYFDGSQYQKVSVERNGSFLFGYTYTITYGSGRSEQTIVRNESGSTTLDTLNLAIYEQSYVYSYDCPEVFGSQPGTSTGTNGQPPLTLYTHETRTPNALEALMDAVSGFCQSIRSDALVTGADHRIAIVGYSSNGFSNTEVLTVDTITDGGVGDSDPSAGTPSFYPTGRILNGVAYGSNGYDSAASNALRHAGIESGYQVIQNAIGALSAHGGTQTLHGLYMAYDILNKQTAQYGEAYASGERKQVVVLFTDGDTDSTPSYVISKAKDIKDLGATVYTVGIFSGANGKIIQDDDQPYWQSQGITYRPDTYSNSSSANALMHGVSSNYPKANDYYNTWYSYSCFGDINKNLAKEDGTFSSYFLSASDSASLNQVFEQISGQVGGATLESLGNSTVLFDEMSEYVSLPADVTTSDIKVSTVAATGQNGTEIVWGDSSDFKATVNIDKATGEVYVTGFDYSENYVGLRDGVMAGKKLVVEIPFVTDGETYGGNNIPTNAGTSGIYNSAGDTCYGNFEVPKVNVPVDYDIDAQDQAIYITTAADLAGLLVYPDKVSGDDFYQPDGVKNRFVDIVYTLKQGNDTIGTLTIPAGKGMTADGAPIWVAADGKTMAPDNLRTCTDYTLSCTVTPIGIADDTLPGQVAVETAIPGESEGPVTATVHVLIPKVEVWDTEIDLGESATIVGDDHSANNHLATNPAKQWVDIKNHTDNVPEATGTEPTVTLGHTFVRGTDPGSAVTYQPTEDSYFKLTVTVNDQKLDRAKGEYNLTIHHTNHDETCLGDYKNDSHNTDNRDDLDFDFIIHVHSVNGDLTLTKTLTALSQGDTEARFTIKVEALNEDGTTANTYYKTLTFTAAGNQAFTMELPTGKYRVTELTTGGYANGTITGGKSENGVWELTYTGLDLSVENTPKNPTYPHDSNTAVNHFTYNDPDWSWSSTNRKPTP